MIYRRFGFLHARLLLYKQDELKEMEEELREMDKRDSLDQKTSRVLRSRRKDDLRKDLAGRESRKDLLQRIEKKALEYGMSHGRRFFLVLALISSSRSTFTTGTAACCYESPGRTRSFKCANIYGER